MIKEIQFYITQIYNLIDPSGFNKDYQYIQESSKDSFINTNELFGWRKKELDNQMVKVRSSLNKLSECTDDMDRLTKQCMETINRAKEIEEKSKEHEKKYKN